MAAGGLQRKVYDGRKLWGTRTNEVMGYKNVEEGNEDEGPMERKCKQVGARAAYPQCSLSRP